MKKIILSVAAIFAFGVVNAQEVKFGAKAGLNLANLTGDVEDASTKVGFNVGGFVEIKISDKFVFQPELLFSTQGAKEDYSIDYGDGEVEKSESTLKLNYLNIPLMAKYYVADKFSLEAGPQVGFLMSAKADVDYTYSDGEGYTESVSGSTDVKDSFKSIDFGLNLGAGYDFSDNFSAGVRYNLGLSSISDDSESDVKNAVISIGVGYKF